LEDGAVDAVPQAPAAFYQGGLLAGVGTGGELGAGSHGRGVPLHDGVLRAELGGLHGGAAAIAADPPVSSVPLVAPARLLRAVCLLRAGPGQ
jgi:hypothetical protein